MAWTNYQLFLAVLMVVTGSINTITAKWADYLKSKSSDGEVRDFDHPYVQAVCMFIGEYLCFITFKFLYRVYSHRGDGSEDVKELTKGNRSFNPNIFLLPAMCDMLATSMMYVGLNLTYASSFQMLRGAVIIFVGILSTGFLDRILKRNEWIGILLVILGLIIVGAADFLTKSNNSEHGRNDIITGDLLIIIAQIIKAVQMVIEEKFVQGKDIPPLQAVGWEGTFGLVVLGFLLIPFYYLHVPPPFSNNPRNVLEDALDAFVQMGNNAWIIIALLGSIVSIAFFTFAGISVTKEISATTRMVLDSVRTIIIWVFSLAFFDQKFHWLQLFGFLFLLSGMALYNGITFMMCVRYFRSLVNRYRHLEEEVIENRKAYVADDSP